MTAAFAPGSTFAGYEIEAIAGRGGMGVVYRARQERPSRRVALKVITPELAEDADFRRRFERESQVAAAIEHPNVIPVYEVGEADGALFIATRFIEGTDLRALLRERGSLPPDVAADLIFQVAAALDAAHEQGLVHRDVKPGNVLIGGREGSWHAYLTDFGLTKSTSGQSGITTTGMVVGTLDYIAPEQLSGGALDARTDVYALGCVLYELLTGQVPYPRESALAVMYAHGSEPPPSVVAVRPELPAQFDEVVARSMAKDPAERYPSAGDFGRATQAATRARQSADTERSVARGEAAAPDATVPTAAPAGRPPRRLGGRAMAIAGVLLAALLAAILAVTLVAGGGDDGGSSSRSEYEDQAIAAVRGVDPKLVESVPTELPEDPDERTRLAEQLDNLEVTMNESAAKLAAIEPPADARNVHERAAAALYALAEVEGRRKNASQAGDPSGYAEASERLDSVNADIQAVREEYRRLGYSRLAQP